VKKYIFLFFVFFIAATLVATVVFLVSVNFEEVPVPDNIRLIVSAVASIFTGIFFVKDKKRVPTQNEGMNFLGSIIFIIIVISIAATIYETKLLVDSSKTVLPETLIVSYIGRYIGAIIEYILVIYIPFYFTCKLLAWRYRREGL
jgi:hypothetical protein